MPDPWPKCALGCGREATLTLRLRADDPRVNASAGRLRGGDRIMLTCATCAKTQTGGEMDFDGVKTVPVAWFDPKVLGLPVSRGKSDVGEGGGPALMARVRQRE